MADDICVELEALIKRYPANRFYRAAVAEIIRQRELVNDLSVSVIAFAGPWATEWAKMHDLPPGHLHPQHYDILEKCGARMVDFTRADLPTLTLPCGEI